MAQATSRTTQALIRRAVEAGAATEEAARRFHRDGLRARTAFDREVANLDLADVDYRQAERESGLGQVHTFADRIGAVIDALLAGRAA